MYLYTCSWSYRRVALIATVLTVQCTTPSSCVAGHVQGHARGPGEGAAHHGRGPRNIPDICGWVNFIERFLQETLMSVLFFFGEGTFSNISVV